MAWFKSITGSNGEVNTYSWSIEKSIGARGTTLLVYILALAVFMSLGPLYFLIFYSITVRKHRINQTKVAIGMSLLWILDYQFGLYSWHFFSAFPETYEFITKVNWMLMIFHILLLIFDKVAYMALQSYDYTFYISIGFFSFASYLFYNPFGYFFNLIFTMAETSLWK